MMVTPHKLIASRLCPNKREAHERRILQPESRFLIGIEKFPHSGLLCNFRETTPVMQVPRRVYTGAHHLKRFCQTLPYKRGTQDRMPLNHSLPRVAQHIGVQVPFKCSAELVEI